MNYNPTSRIRLLSLCIVLAAMLLVSKLYVVQIIRGEDFAAKAERQYQRPNQNVFSRGAIYFQNKDGSIVGAATLRSGYTLAINPKMIKDAAEVYAALAEIVPLSKDDFMARSAKKDDPYEEIGKRLEPDVAEKITALKLPGVMLYKEKWRYYPGNRLAANVLGFVGYDGNTLSGRYGLERYYEDTLARGGENLYSNFFAEIFSGVKKVVHREKFEGDLITAIEPTVELALEKELENLYTKWKAKAAGGVIINPQNGEIYALGAFPTFNPNLYHAERDAAVFSNPLVENVYEMGSIIKPLTMAIGIDTEAITADSTYTDKGFLILNNAKISNFDGKARGTVTMQEVLNQSLNTGVAYIANKVGKERFSKHLLSFGLGEETGIDVPNETAGLVENLKSPRDIEHATASFGQGIAMTPIETVRALAALANGGVLIHPHLVKKIEYKAGWSKDITFPEPKRVLKKETAEEVSRMLVNVVDKALLNGSYKMPQYSIAAKTGTAQMAKPGGGGYYDDRYLHSFFGYFPAYDPKFLIFLYVVEPKDVDYASHTLTEPFMGLVKFLLNYYDVPPDR